MKINLPMKKTFWAAVIIEAAGVVVYAVHLITAYLVKGGRLIPALQPVAMLLAVIGFVLLCLGLTLKGL
jgi:hypothetical protein